MSDVVCEIPKSNPDDPRIRELLEGIKTIAVVGLSDNPERDSYKVAKYMIDHGYTIIPVNPTKESILGQKCWPDLASIPGPVDLVDVFRKMEAVPGVVDEALAIKPRAIWLQLGLAHNESAEKAQGQGVEFVQSRCLKVEHGRLLS